MKMMISVMQIVIILIIMVIMVIIEHLGHKSLPLPSLLLLQQLCLLLTLLLLPLAATLVRHQLVVHVVKGIESLEKDRPSAHFTLMHWKYLFFSIKTWITFFRM